MPLERLRDPVPRRPKGMMNRSRNMSTRLGRSFLYLVLVSFMMGSLVQGATRAKSYLSQFATDSIESSEDSGNELDDSALDHLHSSLGLFSDPPQDKPVSLGSLVLLPTAVLAQESEPPEILPPFHN